MVGKRNFASLVRQERNKVIELYELWAQNEDDSFTNITHGYRAVNITVQDQKVDNKALGISNSIIITKEWLYLQYCERNGEAESLSIRLKSICHFSATTESGFALVNGQGLINSRKWFWCM